MAEEKERGTSFWRFAQLFKSYGIALGIIVAAIPFITQGLNLLPVYESTKSILTFITSLMSLLGVALLFANRRRIGNKVFPPGTRTLSVKAARERRFLQIYIPSALIAFSLLMLIIYIAVNKASVDQAALKFGYDINTGKSMSEMLGDDDNPVDFVEANLFNLVDQEARVSGYAYIDEINGKDVRKFSPNFLSERGVELVLDLTPSVEIPVDWGLYISYLLMFISAAIAFVWLGLIEYMQDVLGFDDKNLLEGPYKTAVTHYFDVPNVKDSKGDQGVIFSLEYDPEAKNKKIITGPDGPFCEEHRTKLQSPVHAGDHYTWWCFYKIGDNLRNHIFYLQYDSVEIMKQAREAAKGEIKSL